MSQIANFFDCWAFRKVFKRIERHLLLTNATLINHCRLLLAWINTATWNGKLQLIHAIVVDITVSLNSLRWLWSALWALFWNRFPGLIKMALSHAHARQQPMLKVRIWFIRKQGSIAPCSLLHVRSKVLLLRWVKTQPEPLSTHFEFYYKFCFSNL